jgi:LSD1 subclass zinc finger protein
MSRVVICPSCRSKGMIPDNPPAARIRCVICKAIFKIDGPAPKPSSVVSKPTAGGARRPASVSPSAPSRNAAFDDSEDVWPGYRLRLMSSVKDVSGIPTAGESLIIVAVAHHLLHFRIFDGDGTMVVDTDAKRLTEQAQQIEDLGQQLESLWRPHELTESEKVRVITSVTSIVGHTIRPPASATDSGFRRSPVESSEDSHPTPLIYGLLGASWVAVVALLAVLVGVLARGAEGPPADVDIGARVAERSHASTTERARGEEATAPAAVESPVSPTTLTANTSPPPSSTLSTVIERQKQFHETGTGRQYLD